MLSDEEKKAIEILKEYLEELEKFDFDCQECGFGQQDERKSLKIVLNLIEKQSKEIEELKEKNEYLPNWVSKKYVSKDKIKAKIEEVKDGTFDAEIVLRSLLEKE